MSPAEATKSHFRPWIGIRRHLAAFIRGDLKKHWYVIPAVGLLMLLLEWMGLLRGLESFALDAFLLGHLEGQSSEIFLVVIDEDNYQNQYGGKSPLDESELKKLLMAIHSGQPKLVAVDLVTTHVTGADFWTPNTVWGRDARSLTERDGTEAGGELIPSKLPVNFRSKLGAGGVMETVPPSGLSVFPKDPDGVIRRYRRVIVASGENESTSNEIAMDSLPWAIVKALHSGTSPSLERDKEHPDHDGTHQPAHDLILSFTTDRFHFPKINSQAAIDLAEKGLLADQLRGKIVIVGGAYSAARDLHATPVGERHGVELVAEAVEAELHHAGIHPFSHGWAFLFDLAAGVLFLYLNYLIPIRISFLVNIPVIGFLSLVTSYVAFHGFTHWLNFTVVLVSLWVHFLWERASELHRYREKFGPLPEH